jgi:chitin synthase
LIEDDPEERYYTHMNLFMCVKYKNSGKLSSHNWFFNGFCKELKPKYAVLLDVGLKPEGEALFKMYKHMKNNPKVGGVCGYMSLKI